MLMLMLLLMLMLMLLLFLLLMLFLMLLLLLSLLLLLRPNGEQEQDQEHEQGGEAGDRELRLLSLQRPRNGLVKSEQPASRLRGHRANANKLVVQIRGGNEPFPFGERAGQVGP